MPLDLVHGVMQAAFDEDQAGRDDAFDAGEVTARLAGLAVVLIPVS